jgi:UDP-glucuronate decarboxylase
LKILVTGGAGFLGSHLCEELLKKEHEVICADNLYTSTKRNINHLLENPNFEFLRHDVTSPLFIEVEGIFNLASPASPVHYQKNPVQTFKTNVHGAMNLLGMAKRTGARILQASTSEVYGNPLLSPQKESYWGNVNPIGIRSCYDEGKRAAETLFTDYRRQYGIDVRIARIFNTYGPRMAINDGRVVSNFIVQALKGEALTIYGDGKQIRSLCYVDDLVNGLQALFFNSKITTPVNIGNPKPSTMLDLANEIIDLTKSKSKVVYMPLPEDDPHEREPDISLAKAEIDWNPIVERTEGLKKTIQYFKKIV